MSSLNGTSILFIGLPGCGKSHVMLELAPAAALIAGVPLLLVDPVDAFKIRRKGYIEAAKLRMRSKSEHEQEIGSIEYDFFTDDDKCLVFSPGRKDDSGLYIKQFIGAVNEFPRGAKEPACVLVWDEGRTIRDIIGDRPFNAAITVSRNIQALNYLSEKQWTETPTAVRSCARCFFIWQGNERVFNVFDHAIDASLLAKPWSDSMSQEEKEAYTVTYFTPLDGKVNHWKPGSQVYPDVLVKHSPASKSIIQSLLR